MAVSSSRHRAKKKRIRDLSRWERSYLIPTDRVKCMKDGVVAIEFPCVMLPRFIKIKSLEILAESDYVDVANYLRDKIIRSMGIQVHVAMSDPNQSNYSGSRVALEMFNRSIGR